MSVPRLPIVPNLAAGAPDLRVPLLRREPYRLLFPLGLAFSWIGASPWLLFALGLTEEWLPVFHALVQVQCFLACMASGFLFTMIPRRTAGAPAAAWEVALAALAPFGTAAFAVVERWVLSQLFWVVSMATLLPAGRETGGAQGTCQGVFNKRPQSAGNWQPALLTRLGLCLAV
jgi:uncharacterized protein involved in response to NO